MASIRKRRKGLSDTPVVGTWDTPWSSMGAGVVFELVLTQKSLRTRRISAAVICNEDQDRTNSALCNGTGVNQSVAERAQLCVLIG